MGLHKTFGFTTYFEMEEKKFKTLVDYEINFSKLPVSVVRNKPMHSKFSFQKNVPT